MCGVCDLRWSGGDWRIGRVGKGNEAREMRQSAWLKRLDCDAMRPETAQSSHADDTLVLHSLESALDGTGYAERCSENLGVAR